MARILVVDDEAPVREALHALLAARGHAVTEAENGLEALKAFAVQAFDLVLSDVVMPEMNGFDLLKALQPQIHERVPFVILSSHDDREGVRAAIYAGAFDYLSKPFDDRLVGEVVERALAAAGGEDPGRKDPGPMSVAPVVSTAPSPRATEGPRGIAALAREQKVVCVPSPGETRRDEAPGKGRWGRLLSRFKRR